MPDADSRTHFPTDTRWAFDESVAAVFPDMLARSIPDLDGMREATTALGAAFLPKERGVVVDLGASCGDALAPFIARFGALHRYVACEVAPAMLARLRERFASWATPIGGPGSPNVVDVLDLDLRADYPTATADLTLACLTLQFVPIDYRPAIIAEAYKRTKPGGAFLVVEKCLGADARLTHEYGRWYHDFKARNGYSRDAIDAKRRSLEGVLVPLPLDATVAMLRAEGFAPVECYWRRLNFAAVIAVKPRR